MYLRTLVSHQVIVQPSRYHLNTIGRLQSDICRICNLERETCEYLLCNYAVRIHLRRKIFDKGLLESSQVWETTPREVIHFITCAIPSWDKAWNQATTITHINSKAQIKGRHVTSNQQTGCSGKSTDRKKS